MNSKKQAMNRAFKNKSEARAFYSSGLEGWDGNLSQMDFKDDKSNVLKVLWNLELFPFGFERVWMEDIWPNFDRYGSRLVDVSERLRDDKQVVLQAIRTHAIWGQKPTSTLDTASERLKLDLDVLAQSVGQGYELRWVPEELQKKVADALLKTTFTRLGAPLSSWSRRKRPLSDVPTIEELPKHLEGDKAFLEIAIPLNTEILKLASDEMKNDPELRKLAGWDE